MNNKNLKPFKLFALKNFPFIEADFDAITNYELLCKIVEYLNKVIASQNETIENVQDLSNAFNELYNYVHDYFDNLDVQEEINNKLDEMVEDGTLEEIIARYVTNALTINSNESDTNSINKKFKNIHVETKYYNGNLYYITHLTNITDLQVLATNDNFNDPKTDAESVYSCAMTSSFDVLLNTSPFNISTLDPLGYQKSNNAVYTPASTPNYLWYACFDANNDMTLIDGHVVTNINDFTNYKNVCTGFEALYIDGNQVAIEDTDLARRQVLAQLNDKSYLIITTGGRNAIESGSSYADLKTVLSLYDVVNAISVDGGGSTQTFINKVSLIPPADMLSIDGRIVPICLGFKVGVLND